MFFRRSLLPSPRHGRTTRRHPLSTPPRLETLEDRIVPTAVATIREATGANAAAIQATVDAFRADLGVNNGATAQSFAGGRREINWDGVPESASSPNDMPAIQFRNRGVVFATPGTAFQVSSNQTGQLRFENLNATYSTAFASFSNPKLFTALDNPATGAGSNITDVHFFIAGSDNLPATTRGFGVVFTDVDVADSTRLEFYDVQGNLLTQRNVLATAGDGSFSFLGMTFTSSAVARVRIVSGNAALGPNDITQGGTNDLVVMDDFIFGETLNVTVAVPGTQLVNAGVPRLFSATTGNALSLAFQNLNPSATNPNSPLEVSLSVSNGTLTLASLAGLTFSAGDGSNDAALTFTGTLASINAALNGLTYRPNAGFVGDDMLTLAVPDTGLRSTVLLDVTTRNADGPGIFDPATANRYLRNTTTGGFPDLGPFAFGAPGWIPVAGDWNGDGTDTLGVFDPASATWFLRNSNSPGAPDFAPFQFGVPGWIPVVGDWDGNGTTTIGVFDPATATWFLRNSNNSGTPDFAPFQFGAPGWIPVVGDWNGNRTTTVGVFDPATAQWFLRNTNQPGFPDIGPFAFGAPGWTPRPGDWDGDGVTTIGVVDPTGDSDPFGLGGAVWFLRNANSGGAPTIAPFAYGAAGWTPLAGNWNFPGEPLRASGGRGPGAIPLDAAPPGIVSAALTRLGTLGFDPALLEALSAARVAMTDLPGSLLGIAATNRILIDDDGAGHGWFVDPTPLEDEEFAAGQALPDGPAAGRLDLLTAVLHELGHLAGLEDEPFGDGLMAEALDLGTRRTR